MILRDRHEKLKLFDKTIIDSDCIGPQFFLGKLQTLHFDPNRIGQIYLLEQFENLNYHREARGIQQSCITQNMTKFKRELNKQVQDTWVKREGRPACIHFGFFGRSYGKCERVKCFDGTCDFQNISICGCPEGSKHGLKPN